MVELSVHLNMTEFVHTKCTYNIINLYPSTSNTGTISQTRAAQVRSGTICLQRGHLPGRGSGLHVLLQQHPPSNQHQRSGSKVPEER